MLYEHYVDLAAGLNAVIDALQKHPDAQVREQVAELLDRIDLLHREPLTRLVETLKSRGSAAVFDELTKDPVVGVLLGLYDLVNIGLPDARSGIAFIPLERLRCKP